MSAQESLIDGVVNNLDAGTWNPEYLLNFTFGELGNSYDPSGVAQDVAGQEMLNHALAPGAMVNAIHMVEHIMGSDHVGAGQVAGHPIEMRDVQQITVQALKNGPATGKAFQRSIRFFQADDLEVSRKRAELLQFFGRANQHVAVGVVQLSESADDVAGIGANAEVRAAPHIESNSHETI